MNEHPGHECTDPRHCTRQAVLQANMPHYWIQTLERWMKRHGVTDRDLLIHAMIACLTYRPTSIDGDENARLRAYHEELNRQVEREAKRRERNRAIKANEDGAK
jgi:hypothetical protein